MTKNQGYVTAAVHHPRHLEMAVDLRLSLRAIDPDRPCAIVTDQKSAKGRDALLKVFEHVHIIPDSENYGHSAKLYVAEASPCAQTLFLDADCLALRPLDELWAALQSKTFTVPGVYVDNACMQHHHNYPIAHLCAKFGLTRYYFASSPIFYFDEVGRSVLRTIRQVYNDELRHSAVRRWDRNCPPDEIAFGIVGGRHAFASFPPHKTIMDANDMLLWKGNDAPESVYHCVVAPSMKQLAIAMRELRGRRVAAGLPDTSWIYWVQKAMYKKAQRSINQKLGLPWRYFRAQ